MTIGCDIWTGAPFIEFCVNCCCWLPFVAICCCPLLPFAMKLWPIAWKPSPPGLLIALKVIPVLLSYRWKTWCSCPLIWKPFKIEYSERNNYRNMWNRFGPILLRRSLNRLIRWWRWCLRFRWCLGSEFQDLFRLDHLLVLFIRARCVRVDLLELVADLCLVIFSSRKECEIGWFGNLEFFTCRVLGN